MPRRRERILGFDRLNGIEIADLADRLVEVWPDESGAGGDVAQARGYVDALEHGIEQIARSVAEMRAELARVEGRDVPPPTLPGPQRRRRTCMADYTVKRFDEMAAKMDGAFKLARASLGVTSFGMQIVDMPPGAGEFYPNHDHLHDGQEEVYVVLAGGGTIAIDGEHVPVEADTAVRVAPDARRQLFPGEDGMRVLILGGVPGKAYEAPDFSKPEPPKDAA